MGRADSFLGQETCVRAPMRCCSDSSLWGQRHCTKCHSDLQLYRTSRAKDCIQLKKREWQSAIQMMGLGSETTVHIRPQKSEMEPSGRTWWLLLLMTSEPLHRLRLWG